MMKSLVVFLTAAVTAAALLGALPATGRAGPIKVLGGGVGTFDAFPRLVSYYGVEATRQDDGTTTGQFACVVVDCCAALGSFDRSTLNDDGSVKLEGTTSIFNVDGTVVEDIALAVTVWEGGPKQGRFLFSIPLLPDPGDYETALFGGILIPPGQSCHFVSSTPWSQAST